jgi:putative PIN family toxin of toxin-antitoxin system
VIDEAERLVDLVAASGEVVQTSSVLAVMDDESDNRVLEAAIDGAADYIVSGDDDLLGLESFQGIRILAPGEFAAEVLDP